MSFNAVESDNDHDDRLENQLTLKTRYSYFDEDPGNFGSQEKLDDVGTNSPYATKSYQNISCQNCQSKIRVPVIENRKDRSPIPLPRKQQINEDYDDGFW